MSIPVVPESIVKLLVNPDLIVSAPPPVTIAPEAPKLMDVAAPPMLSVVAFVLKRYAVDVEGLAGHRLD